jgi:hypothetical protein
MCWIRYKLSIRDRMEDNFFVNSHCTIHCCKHIVLCSPPNFLWKLGSLCIHRHWHIHYNYKGKKHKWEMLNQKDRSYKDISYLLSQKYVSKGMLYIVLKSLCILCTYNHMVSTGHYCHRQNIPPHKNSKAPLNTLSKGRCHMSRNYLRMNSFCNCNDISHKFQRYFQNILFCKCIDCQLSPCNFVLNTLYSLLQDPDMSGNCKRKECKLHLSRHRKIFGVDKRMLNSPLQVFQWNMLRMKELSNKWHKRNGIFGMSAMYPINHENLKYRDISYLRPDFDSFLVYKQYRQSYLCIQNMSININRRQFHFKRSQFCTGIEKQEKAEDFLWHHKKCM